MEESFDYAPFGRAGIVLTWPHGKGFAAALHPKFPLLDELRAFLLHSNASTRYRRFRWKPRGRRCPNAFRAGTAIRTNSSAPKFPPAS